MATNNTKKSATKRNTQLETLVRDLEKNLDLCARNPSGVSSGCGTFCACSTEAAEHRPHASSAMRLRSSH